MELLNPAEEKTGVIKEAVLLIKSLLPPMRKENFFNPLTVFFLYRLHEFDMIFVRLLKKGGVVNKDEYLIAVEGEFFRQVD